MSYTCPVCGYPCLTKPPRQPQSGGASFEICPSCRYQFGYTDDLLEIDYPAWRKRWIAEGMPWRDVDPQPSGWDPAVQLRRLDAPHSSPGERGQALVELAGVLAVVAVIIVALVGAGLPGQVASAVAGSVSSILSGSSAAFPRARGLGAAGVRARRAGRERAPRAAPAASFPGVLVLAEAMVVPTVAERAAAPPAVPEPPVQRPTRSLRRSPRRRPTRSGSPKPAATAGATRAPSPGTSAIMAATSGRRARASMRRRPSNCSSERWRSTCR